MTSPEPRRAAVRRNTVAVVLLMVFVAFAARLVYVQAIRGPELAEEAREDRLREYTLTALRGEILDTNGEVLATSVERYNLAVNQVKVAQYVRYDDDGNVIDTGASAAADLLAPLLDEDPAELGGKMVGDSTWVYLAKGLTPTEWREIRDLGILGIEPEAVTERVYPMGNTAGNVVGFLGSDGTALAGMELSYDDALTGEDGWERVEIGSGGQVIPGATYEVQEATAGSDLVLTINADVQFMAQQALDEAVSNYGASWAGVAVMDLTDGSLVALAESGTVDPGDPEASSEDSRGARSATTPYEPGSTGKLLTLAAAIDQGVVTPTSEFDVPYETTIDGQTFNDTVLEHPTYRMTTAGILANSSNIGTIQIGNLMSDETRYEYMKSFGFGSTTDVGLPGESAGLLSAWDEWDGRTRMTTMFGQGYAVTLLQNVAMVAAIGNDGVYQSPVLVKEIQEADGTVTTPEREESHRVISEDAAQTMLDMMEGVVQEGGTGELAAIDGYRVAGKTGTAEIITGTGVSGLVANFVGVVPADQPRFALAVVIYRPSTGYYGGTIAAPLFHDVAEFALQTYGVQPSSGEAPKYEWIVE